MFGDLNIVRFIMLVLMFVISITFLIISPNIISILLGWDGLVLVSYLLVMWNVVPPHPGYRPAASSVHYTTSCKHSLVLLRMAEIIARNMLS